jgi:hypothetical protein
MKTKFLLPYRLKAIGWILFVPSAIFLLIVLFTGLDIKPQFFDAKVLSLLPKGLFASNAKLAEIIPQNIFIDLVCIVCIAAGILVAFSKEKNEDEFIGKLRLESLVWATYATYAILIFSIIFFYEVAFLTVLMVNMFTLLAVFIVRFNFTLFKLKRQNHEK